ncbi:MAG: hypothetical protein K9I82_02535 [Chitinophagaceae bacterium]|nr:hypothetical protein [Chitinophagaceae bacterium]
MNDTFTAKMIFRQILNDLSGKDAYQGITLTYTWMANQFGHLSLGFFLTLILNFVFENVYKIPEPSLIGAICSTIFWIIFEMFNFLFPLLLSRNSAKNNKKQYPFQPPWLNIAFDTFTDICFFGIGSCIAGLYLHTHLALLISLVALLFIALYPTYYWYLSKMYLQNAKFPFQFRLSQWMGSITNNDRKKLYQFLHQSSNGNHLFILGARKTGKTSLAVGLSSEFSITNKACYYVTAMKLFNILDVSEAELNEDKNQIWNFRNSNILVIDDINPSLEDCPKLVTPTLFYTMLCSNENTRLENEKLLIDKNTIWVLGKDFENLKSWMQMLEQFGVKRDNIFSINLDSEINN